jgi:hypothetical protein
MVPRSWTMEDGGGPPPERGAFFVQSVHQIIDRATGPFLRRSLATISVVAGDDIATVVGGDVARRSWRARICHGRVGEAA